MLLFFVVLKYTMKNIITKGCDTITNERKTRMVKDKAKQGTDCYTFEVSFQGDLKNLPKQPFTVMDSICLEMINCDCEKQSKQLLGFEIYSKVKSIECNITQKVSGKATQSDVLNILDHAFLTFILMRQNEEIIRLLKKIAGD